MEKEFITSNITRITLNVAGSEINSLRKIVDTYNTVRVYDNGCIGVAGSVGEADWQALTAQATEKLADGIPYPSALPQHHNKTLNTAKKLNHAQLLPRARALMQAINAVAAERFVMSGGLFYTEATSTYRNSLGVDYRYEGSRVEFELILKDKNLANLFDTAYSFTGEDLDADGILADFTNLVRKYDVPAQIEDGMYPVVMEPSFIATAGRHLLGELYAVGASLFSGKLGEKLFNDNFTMYNDYTGSRPCRNFFDAEGETGKGYIVKNGVLTGLLTTKRVSAKYNLPYTVGTASEYDSIPTFGYRCVLDSTCDVINNAYKGKAVLVMIASGGDMTTSGDYATPVQNAYLLQDGVIVGRLPDLKIHGNIYNLLGDGFLGASNKGIFQAGLQDWVAVNMKVEH